VLSDDDVVTIGNTDLTYTGGTLTDQRQAAPWFSAVQPQAVGHREGQALRDVDPRTRQ